MKVADKTFKVKNLNPFDEKIWNSGARSPFLTPLYVDRFKGIRSSLKSDIHDFWEFTCVLDGEGKFFTEKDIQLYENSIIIVPAGMAHHEFSEERLDTIWVGLSGEVFNTFPQKLQIVNNEKLAEKFYNLWLFAQRGFGMIGTELDGLCLDILGCFQRLIREGIDQTEDIIEKSVNYLNEHFSEQISISELAKKFNFSEGHFFRLFKKRIGLTPITYLTNIRIQNAVHWLNHSDLPVLQIAELVGYQDQFYFSRAFKKIMKSSPRNFRRSRINYE